MNIELKESDREENLNFPMLMRYIQTGVVWLALGERRGILIHDPNGYVIPNEWIERDSLLPFSDPTWEQLPPGSTVTFTQE